MQLHSSPLKYCTIHVPYGFEDPIPVPVQSLVAYMYLACMATIVDALRSRCHVCCECMRLCCCSQTYKLQWSAALRESAPTSSSGVIVITQCGQTN